MKKKVIRRCIIAQKFKNTKTECNLPKEQDQANYGKVLKFMHQNIDLGSTIGLTRPRWLCGQTNLPNLQIIH